MSGSPSCAAQCSGVHPRPSRSEPDAPAASSPATTSRDAARTARCSALRPALSCRSGSPLAWQATCVESPRFAGRNGPAQTIAVAEEG